MLNKTLALLFACLPLSAYVNAFEVIAEDDLSAISAQDGVTILVGLPTTGWTAQSVEVIDKTGIESTIKPGYEFNTAGVLARNLGIKTCTENTRNGSCTSISGPSIRLDFDIVGDNNGAIAGGEAMLNMSFALVNGANKMRIYIDKIALRNGAGNNESAYIDFGGRTGGDIDAAGDYFDIVPTGSLALLNLQLGNEAQGKMLQFTNGNFGTIDFGVISFLDKQYTPANNRSLRFGFQMDNVDLTGTGFDLTPDGLTYSASSFVTPMDITLSNISAGNITSTNMGTIGIKGLQVTNFTLSVSGKS